ncbi:MAG: hypothetical protein AAFR04_12445 [Pseudomonadota bacterium]
MTRHTAALQQQTPTPSMVRRRDGRSCALWLLAGFVLAVSLGACAGPPSTAQIEALTTGPLLTVNAPPATVYERIARGAMACWFGATGRFKGSHVFFAKADPPERGGNAHILVHQRETSNARRRSNSNGNGNGGAARGLVVLRININATSGRRSAVTLINRKLKDEEVARVRAEVQRFTRGRMVCADGQTPARAQVPPPTATITIKRAKP